jgi:hypothetical protein
MFSFSWRIRQRFSGGGLEDEVGAEAEAEPKAGAEADEDFAGGIVSDLSFSFLC